MGAYAKAELRVLVNHLTIGCVVVQICGEKCFIFENLLNEFTNLLSACWTGICRENSTTFSGK
jgi:hypothetical protein